MLLVLLVVVFVLGYLSIALEHQLKIEKAAVALLLGMVLWTLYGLCSQWIVPVAAPGDFAAFLASHPSLQGEPLSRQTIEYVLDADLVRHLGDITQTLFFLMGAMTIVELVDAHGGFSVITSRITTRNKRRLLWVICTVTFCLSAVLDNLTTTIVMLMLLRKLVKDQHERWLYAGCIVIAANCGGAWSPIGDVTTIMLWVKGNVTVGSLIAYVLAPSIVAVVIPILCTQRWLKGSLQGELAEGTSAVSADITEKDRKRIFYLGVGGLLFVPVFKTVTHMPPFVGILLVLGMLWTYTELMYNHKHMKDLSKELRLPRIISRIDMPSILFFLGILMAVAVLESTGILHDTAMFLDKEIHNIYIINILLGALSSIVDNVPLVAGVMGMYPIADPAAVGYMENFVVDGHFWAFLSYCAGVGGSILIIGSAAGVIAMGLERIPFGWYLKRFSLLALFGYLAGAGVYIIEAMFY